MSSRQSQATEPEVLQLDERQIQHLRTVGIQVSIPLHSPDYLKRYHDIDPALVNEIVGMAKKEQANRHQSGLFENVLRAFGLLGGLALGAGLIWGIIFLAYHGKSLQGAWGWFVAGGGVVAIAAYRLWHTNPRYSQKGRAQQNRK